MIAVLKYICAIETALYLYLYTERCRIIVSFRDIALALFIVKITVGS